MLLSLDEAHEYLTTPSDLGSRSGYLVRKFRQAAKRGRKDKFGLYIITQTPQDIDEDVRKQMNTRIYLGLERDVVESHDVFVPEGVQRGRHSIQQRARWLSNSPTYGQSKSRAFPPVSLITATESQIIITTEHRLSISGKELRASSDEADVLAEFRSFGRYPSAAASLARSA